VSRPGFDPELFEPLAGVEERSFWFRARNRLIVSTFLRRFPSAESFLEIGCGSGVVLAALHEAFPALRLTGSELYEEGLDIARRRLPDVELVILDARELPFVDAFDVVGAFDVLEHIDEDELVLEQMLRAARPGGGVFVLVPQHQWLWSEHDEIVEHRRRYTRRELVGKAERAGIEILEVTSFVSSLLPAMAVSRAIDRVRKKTDPIANLEPGPLNGVLEKVLAPARKLIERGVSLPLASDCNPGTCPTENLPLVGTLACTQMGMLPSEVLAALTLNAAAALGRSDRIGSLEPGKQADLIVVALDSPSAIPLYAVYSQLVYALKGSDVETVIVGGRPVMEGRRLLTLDTARIAARAREWQGTVFVAEVGVLRARGVPADAPGLRTVGYPEMAALLDGRATADEALAALVLATRRFAKRQRTWFRRDPRISWLDGARADVNRAAELLVRNTL